MTPDSCGRYAEPLQIRLNGDPYVLDSPATIQGLLDRLQIDARRVAVEHNLIVVKRGMYEQVTINEGDEVEIVNFVGGGCCLQIES